MKRLGVRYHSARGVGDEQIEKTQDVSGTFLVRSIAVMRNQRYAVFRDVTPTMRIGNLLIYRGTFHIPWIRQEAMLGRARRTLYSPNPDLDKAKNYLREILAGDSNNFFANVELGNVMVFRKRPEEAQRYSPKCTAAHRRMSLRARRWKRTLRDCPPTRRCKTFRV
jgi:hypothetical protein